MGGPVKVRPESADIAEDPKTGAPEGRRADNMVKMCASVGMRDEGFTLLEVILVVAILAVLAALAIPRLSRGSSGAGDAALESDLDSLQKAIDLYAAEHHDQYPSADSIAGQLTQYTDGQGQVRAAKDTTHIYGPYLQAIPPLPVGPRKGSAKIALVDADGVGWLYNPDSGQIRANTGPIETTPTELNP